MVYQPVTRVPVADQVFGQLRDQILTGALAPDDPLPAERELAVRFGVNRHAIREAVKRLQQARLVRVSQGGLTRVLDWRHSAGLDLMVAIRDSGEQLPIDSLARDLAEMRACVGADAARQCAGRASAAVRDAVLRAADGFAGSTDLDALAEADLAFWRAVILGSGNLAYLLSFNSLVDCGLAVPPMPAGRRAAELLDVGAHQALARHIAAGDADAAEQVARDLLSPAEARPARRRPPSRPRRS